MEANKLPAKLWRKGLGVADIPCQDHLRPEDDEKYECKKKKA